MLRRISNPGSNDGLTLIEVAFALVIFGLLLTGFIVVYNQYREQQKIVTTQGNLLMIQSALQKYVANNGHYPRPAQRTLPLTNASAGIEIPYTGAPADYAAWLANLPICIYLTTTVCRTPSYVAGQTVLIGDVPFATLGLPVDFIADGYGYKYTYAITERLTRAATFADDGGLIKVIDESGQDYQGTSSNVHYVIYSHGQNARGAFSLDGKQVTRCTTAVGANGERKNCDNNAEFQSNYGFSASETGADGQPRLIYARQQVLGDTNRYYDDYMVFATRVTTDIWSRLAPAPGQPANTLSNSSGNVRIGGSGPPLAKLDVKGDAQAETLNVIRLCDAPADTGAQPCHPLGQLPVGANENLNYRQFNPAAIGGVADAPNYAGQPGAGIICKNRVPMEGIENANEICALHIPISNYLLGDCPEGQYALGTTSTGQLLCALPP